MRDGLPGSGGRREHQSPRPWRRRPSSTADQDRFAGFELVPGLHGPYQGSTRLTGRLSSPRRVGNATERRCRPLKLGTTASLRVPSPALIGLPCCDGRVRLEKMWWFRDAQRARSSCPKPPFLRRRSAALRCLPGDERDVVEGDEQHGERLLHGDAHLLRLFGTDVIEQ